MFRKFVVVCPDEVSNDVVKMIMAELLPMRNCGTVYYASKNNVVAFAILYINPIKQNVIMKHWLFIRATGPLLALSTQYIILQVLKYHKY